MLTDLFSSLLESAYQGCNVVGACPVVRDTGAKHGHRARQAGGRNPGFSGADDMHGDLVQVGFGAAPGMPLIDEAAER